MSAKGVEQVFSRAMNDIDFADLVFTNPELALAGYELTAEEIERILSMTHARLEVVAETFPEDRRSFGWYNHNETGLTIRA